MAEALKDEMDLLRQQMKEMELKHKVDTKPAPIYVRSERKMTKLAGRPVKDSDPDVDDWISDMKEHISSLPTNEGKIEFILDHLTGNAKTEVRLRPTEMKRTPKEILKIIEDTYKIQDTLAILRHKFYERNHQENKTLEAYSLALMKLMDKICKKEGDVANKDKVLMEKFIDGVRETQLKRELRRIALESSPIPFFEFRRRMFLLVDDQPPELEKTASVNMHMVEQKAVNNESMAMLLKQQELLEKQQQQIEMLTNLTQKTSYRQFNGRGRANSRGRTRGRGYGRGYGRTPSLEFIPTCYFCHEEGHKRNECPKLQSKDRTQKVKEDPKA